MEECPNCGQNIKKDDTVCPYCGADINREEQATEETVEESGPLTEKEKIESEILDSVIKRVDAYWENKWQEKAESNTTAQTNKAPAEMGVGEAFAGKESFSSRSKAIDVLGLCAWLILVVGVIGAIVIWRVMGGISISGQSGAVISSYLGLALGLASLLGGIVSCAYLLVVCSIAEDLSEIRNKLLP